MHFGLPLSKAKRPILTSRQMSARSSEIEPWIASRLIFSERFEHFPIQVVLGSLGGPLAHRLPFLVENSFRQFRIEWIGARKPQYLLIQP
jgi:hypothetical protein